MCAGNKVNSLGRATDKERCSCGLSANNTADKVRGDHDWTLVLCGVRTNRTEHACGHNEPLHLTNSQQCPGRTAVNYEDRQTEHWETVGHYVNWHLKISLQYNTTCIKTRISTHPM